MANKDLSKQWFETGDYPTQAQFAQVFDWLRWKDEQLMLTDVISLVATLNNKAALVGGKVPLIQLPAFVDDSHNLAGFPTVGQAGIFYVDKDTDLIYRWKGSAYQLTGGSGSGGGGGGAWGTITGDINAQTDLKAALDALSGAINAEATERANTDITLQTSIDGKVDKVTGKGLSTEDYTTAEKTKLAGIAAGAQVNDANTTIQGNTFNGASQLVQMGSDGKLPAIDGSKLTGIAAGGAAIDDTTPSTSTVYSSSKVVSITGLLASLNTTDKTALVNAINEVLAKVSANYIVQNQKINSLAINFAQTII